MALGVILFFHATMVTASPEPQDVAPSPLHLAVDAGDFDGAQKLIVQGADVNATNDIYETPLHRAAETGRLALATLLLDNGAGLETHEINGETPLHKAAIHDRFAVMRVLVERGADVNALDGGDGTPLLYAAGNAKSVAFLIENGADVNAAGETGNSILHAVAANGSVEVAKTLVAHGANLYATNEEAKTPLDHAVEFNGREMARFLEQAMADRPPSDWDLTELLCAAAAAGDMDKVKAHISRGADVNSFDGGNYTPLHHAAQGGHLAVVKALIALGAEVNVKSGNDETPLHFATDGGYGDVVKILIDHGADASVLSDTSPTEDPVNPCPNGEAVCPFTAQMCEKFPRICEQPPYFRSPPGTPPCAGARLVESDCSWRNDVRQIECLTAWDTSACK